MGNRLSPSAAGAAPPLGFSGFALRAPRPPRASCPRLETFEPADGSAERPGPRCRSPCVLEPPQIPTSRSPSFFPRGARSAAERPCALVRTGGAANGSRSYGPIVFLTVDLLKEKKKAEDERLLPGNRRSSGTDGTHSAGQTQNLAAQPVSRRGRDSRRRCEDERVHEPPRPALTAARGPPAAPRPHPAAAAVTLLTGSSRLGGSAVP